MVPATRFRVLGAIEVERAGVPIALGGTQLRRLLSILLLDRSRPVSRELLIDRLWSGRPPATAATALHVHIGRLRRVLEPGASGAGGWRLLRSSPAGYVLDAGPDALDVDEYEAHIAAADQALRDDPATAHRRMIAAGGLWRGRPWAVVADEPWARPEVARLEEVRRNADELWVDISLALGRHRRVLDRLRRAVEEEPFRERRWEQLIVALYRDGRQTDALHAYHEARVLLREELGIDPRPQLRELERAVLLHDASLDPTAVRRRRPGRRHNLPPVTTSMVGREDERKLLGEELDRGGLVTLTGPAGAGKTRLALVAAHDRLRRHRDGVWLADLSGIDSPRLVATQIASELALRETDEHGAGGPDDVLVNYLADREVLLVVDNCEHVAGEAARVLAGLIANCPRLTVLATSRVPLGVSGEVCIDTTPLVVPAPGASVEEITNAPAVRLFLDRSRDAGAPPYPSEQLGAVAELCRAVDGIPLLVEMTASQANALSPDAMAARLGAGRANSAFDAAIDWSVALLAPTDRLLVRRLGAFAGGFALSGAEALGRDAGLSADETAGALTRLVSASLIRFDLRTRPARYCMLEPIRDHARARLREAGEEDAAQQTVVEYLVRLADRVRPSTFLGPPDPTALETLDVELDNVRGSLDRLLASADPTEPLRLASSMGTYWMERGYWGEGQRWLAAALETGDAEPTLERGRALSALVRVTSSFAGIAARRESIEQAVAIFRHQGATDDLMIALTYAAFAAGWHGDTLRMRACFDEAESLADPDDEWVSLTVAVYKGLARALVGDLAGALATQRSCADALLACGDPSFASRALMYAGTVARLLGDRTGAQRDLARSIELSTASGAHGTHAHAVLALAQISAELAEPDSIDLLLESLEKLETVGDLRCAAICRATIGRLACRSGKAEEGSVWLRRAVPHLARLDVRYLALVLADLASVVREQDPERAAQLVAVARALGASPGLPWSGDEQRHFEQICAGFSESFLERATQQELVELAIAYAAEPEARILDSGPESLTRV